MTDRSAEQGVVYTKYLRSTDLKMLCTALCSENPDYLSQQVDHFTRDEAEHRDDIVLSYFGSAGVEQLSDIVAGEIVSERLPRSPALLDVGAGIGTFTLPIVSRVRARFPKARTYALDITPAMLEVLSGRASYIVPILGIAEDITRSVAHAKKHFAIPDTFDAIFSTLTLHHCPDIGKVFDGLHRTLSMEGVAVIVDLCRHDFTEFREEMGDYHMGFELDVVKNAASQYFEDVTVRKLPESRVVCTSTGRSAALFMATLKRRK